MIEANLTDLSDEAMLEINALASGDTLKLREAMLKFLRENYQHGSGEYCEIAEFINDFFVCRLGEFDSDN
jgi:hypothetical protein